MSKPLVRIGTEPFPPYSNPCASSYPSPACPDLGIELSPLVLSLESLGLRPTLENLDDVSTAERRIGNGSLDAFGMLMNTYTVDALMNEDLGAVPLTMPIDSDRLVFVYRQLSTNFESSATIFPPVGKEVVLAFVLSLLLVKSLRWHCFAFGSWLVVLTIVLNVFSAGTVQNAQTVSQPAALFRSLSELYHLLLSGDWRLGVPIPPLAATKIKLNMHNHTRTETSADSGDFRQTFADRMVDDEFEWLVYPRVGSPHPDIAVVIRKAFDVSLAKISWLLMRSTKKLMPQEQRLFFTSELEVALSQLLDPEQQVIQIMYSSDAVDLGCTKPEFEAVRLSEVRGHEVEIFAVKVIMFKVAQTSYWWMMRRFTPRISDLRTLVASGMPQALYKRLQDRNM